MEELLKEQHGAMFPNWGYIRHKMPYGIDTVEMLERMFKLCEKYNMFVVLDYSGMYLIGCMTVFSITAEWISVIKKYWHLCKLTNQFLMHNYQFDNVSNEQVIPYDKSTIRVSAQMGNMRELLNEHYSKL